MNKLYNDTAVQAIANAIRAKNGSSDTYTIAEMSDALNDLSYYTKPIISNVALATFEADGLPLNSLKVSVEAKQDLHGYDHPWVGGAGKNKLEVTATTQTINGVTFTPNSDGTIKVNGTATSHVVYDLYYANVSCPYNGYILSGCPQGGGGTTYDLRVSDVTTTSSTETGTGRIINLTDTGQWSAQIIVRNGVTVNNLVFKPMIRLATETDATFEPYSNECPISGWSEVNVSDVDDVDNPTVTQTTTISLGQTVYGAEVDVVNGTSGNKITHQLETISGGITRTDSSGYLFVVKDLDVPDITDYETVTPYIISNYLAPYSVNNLRANAVFGFTQYNKRLYIRLGADITTVADANAFLASNPLQIKYELATPTTLTTSPTPIKSLEGTNNLSVDSGDVIELEYFKEV